MGNYIFHLLNMIGIYLILAYSLNLVLGFGGLMSFCHAVFYGIGAYAYTLVRVGKPGSAVAKDLLWSADWPVPMAVLFAVAVSAIVAHAVGRILLRFRGDFFVFASLGFQMVVFVVLYNWLGLSNGPFGIYGIPRPEIFGQVIRTPAQFLPLILGANLLLLPLLFLLYRSPFGLSLAALREDALAAQSLGICARKQYLAAFTLAAAFAAVAGALFAAYVSYINPTVFNLKESLFIATILLVGGSGNIKGPLAGVLLMLLLPEVLRFLHLPGPLEANLREILYGLILIVLMLFRSQGLAGDFRVK